MNAVFCTHIALLSFTFAIDPAHQVPFISNAREHDSKYTEASKQHWGNHAAQSPLDVLTSSPAHTIFVRLLQRARLLPLLIRLIEYGDDRGLTILAPTNDAIEFQLHGELALWQQCLNSDPIEDATGVDNIGARLRQHLLHHIVNYTLPYDVITNRTRNNLADRSEYSLPLHRPDIHSTLHRPSRSLLEEPTRPGPIPQPPGGPRHPGAEDRGGLLGGEGQKFRTVWKWASQDETGDRDPTAAKHKRSTGSLWFDVDATGQGGFQAIEEYRTPKGLVISLNGTLTLPPSLHDLIRTHPSLGLLSSILEEELLHTMSHTAHVTCFLPSAAAFESLSSLQRSYLLRNISNEEQRDGPWRRVLWDRTKVLGWHISGRGLLDDDGQWGTVAYAGRLRTALECNNTLQLTSILGGPLQLRLEHEESPNDTGSRSEKSILVGEGPLGRIIEEDILTENGVVHIVDTLLPPTPTAWELDVEKTLLAMNASRFVGMMRKAGLQNYLTIGGAMESVESAKQPRNQTWTLVVPADEVLHQWLDLNPDLAKWWRQIEDAEISAKEDSPLRTDEIPPESNSVGVQDSDDDRTDPLTELRELLQYHILPRIVRPSEVIDHSLLPTELQHWRLKEGRQRILATVSDVPGKRSDKTPADNLTFGGASVLAEPAIVNEVSQSRDAGTVVRPVAIIYPISQLLAPPEDPIQTAVSASLHLSTFVAAVFSCQLDEAVKRAPGVTYLVPNNDAFTNLGGMIMRYLLFNRDESRKALRRLVEYHAIDEIVYSQDFVRGLRQYPTLDGSSIWAGKADNGSNTISVYRQGGFDDGAKPIPEDTSMQPAHVRSEDFLTNTGVLHELDKVEYPADLDLTNGKLLQGAKCDTFRDLIMKAGYGFVLNGTAPKRESDEENAGVDENEHWSLWRKSGDKKRKKKHRRRHRLFDDPAQSYVLLAPTDEAFTRLNLTHYLANPDKLKQLVQLHILPSPASDDVGNWQRASEQHRSSAGVDGGRRTRFALPIGLMNGWSLPSLLDRSVGGQNRYGKVAFREIAELPDDGSDDDTDDDDDQIEQQPYDRRMPLEAESGLRWQVGILGTRGKSGTGERDKHSARIIDFGRESRAITAEKPSQKGRTAPESPDLRPSLGGVLVISSVLEPYRPSGFYRYGWIILTVILSLAAAAAIGWAVWWSWSRTRKGNKRGGEDAIGEAMEGEEE